MRPHAALADRSSSNRSRLDSGDGSFCPRPVLATFLFAALAAFVLPATARLARAEDVPSLAGHWTGAIELPGQELEFDLDFASQGDAWTGDITIPAQGAEDLPLTAITVDADSVSFAIAGVPGAPTFRGAILPCTPARGGQSAPADAPCFELSGRFTQGGQVFPFQATSGEDPADQARKALEGIDAVIEAALEDWRTPGLAVGVILGDEPILLRGYGLRDVEAGLPVTPRTLFAIGSTTKAFTTFTLATLVDEGKLDWDVPVREYIPEFHMYDEYASAHLTPRDMVTHRSGLPRHDLVWYNNEDVTRAELVRRLRYLEPNKELRETWQYNNLMFLTAGYLTEVLTGRSWEDAVRARVLDPLGMARTNFSVLESQASDDYALPYLLEDDELRQVAFRPLSVIGGAGSMNSSAEEMLRWVAVHLSAGGYQGQQLISKGALEELHTPQMVLNVLPTEPESSPLSYAFGWFVQSAYGHLTLQHGGNIDGFSALVTFYPHDDLGIVALSNRNADALPGLVTATIADRILDLSDKDWIAEAARERDEMQQFAERGEEKKEMFRQKGTRPSRSLASFAGEYRHPGYGTVRIRSEKKGLVMVHNGMEMPLEHWHYDVFSVTAQDDEVIPENLRIVFVENAEGRISGIRAAFEPMIDPIFFERLPDPELRNPEFLARLVGEYEVPGDQVLVVTLQGGALVGQVSGQPAIELLPSVLDEDGAEFTIEEVKGLSFRFVLDPKGGPAPEVLLLQAGGVYELPRRKTAAG